MKILVFLLALAALSNGRAFAAPLVTPYRIEEIDPATKPSYYSRLLPQILEHWPPPTLSLWDTRPEILRGIKTQAYPDMIGMVKHFEVKAPFEKVVELNDRVEDFPKMWEDVLNVKIVSRDRNRVTTEWTRKAPAFFLSKLRYRMTSVSDKSTSGRAVYRNQLIDGDRVKSSDSLVVIERLGTDRTRVSVFNFFDPDVGPFRGIAGGKIWKQSLRNAFKEDVAFRSRLEHSDWDADRLSDEADKVLDKFPIDEIEYTDLLHFNGGGPPEAPHPR